MKDRVLYQYNFNTNTLTHISLKNVFDSSYKSNAMKEVKYDSI